MLHPIAIALEKLFITVEDLVESGQFVVDNWEGVDLAAAVTALNQQVSAARHVLTYFQEEDSVFSEKAHSQIASRRGTKDKSREQFNAIIAGIPHYCAVFNVTLSTPTLRYMGLELGQEVRFYPNTPDLGWYETNGHPTLKDGSVNHLVDVPPSQLRFLRYEPVTEFPWDKRRRIGQVTL